MQPSPILEAWSYHCKRAETIDVPPDGCRDIIFVSDAVGRTTAHLFELARSNHRGRGVVGTSMRGLRLRPGTIIDTVGLHRWLTQTPLEPDMRLDEISAFLSTNASLDEALTVLATPDIKINNGAKFLGQTQRTLQRLVAKHTGQPPVFWRQLARARRTAKALFRAANVAEIAYTFGYADQAHLARDMQTWFGYRPSAIAANAQLHANLLAKAYC